MRPATHENDLRNDERDMKIIRLVKSGFSYTAVGERLGITRNVVASVCRRNGIKSKPEHVKRNLSSAVKAAWQRVDREQHAEATRQGVLRWWQERRAHA